MGAEDGGGLLHGGLHCGAEGGGGGGAVGVEECVDFADGVEAGFFRGGAVWCGGGVVVGDVEG